METGNGEVGGRGETLFECGAFHCRDEVGGGCRRQGRLPFNFSLMYTNRLWRLTDLPQKFVTSRFGEFLHDIVASYAYE